MAKSGVHWGREYKGINTVRNIIRRGEWFSVESKSAEFTWTKVACHGRGMD